MPRREREPGEAGERRGGEKVVEQHHRDTLQFVVAETNKQYRDWRRVEDDRRAREEAGRERRRKNLEDASKRIKFD